jgi:hypothetical protein
MVVEADQRCASALSDESGLARVEKIKFLVQGSAADPYELVFEHESSTNRIVALCTCPAGRKGTYCKHRLAILDGIDADVVSANPEHIAVVASWLPGSGLADAIDGLAKAEREVEEAKRAVARAKKTLAATMHGR